VNAQANNTEDKTQELCEKLYLAAKTSKTRRFHALYDKVYMMDFLTNAWKQIKQNKGSAGIDNESIEDIIQKGEERVLLEIQKTLMENEYRPRSVKRVLIPKPDGRERPLGIPTIRDRIVQASTKALIEPIFEADFLECSYGFRIRRSPHDALEEIRKTMNAGYVVVLDADITGYFDNINHNKLMGFVEQRINDRRILKLIRKWLECGVIDTDGFHETDKGTPQGGVISPLLANIYLHELDKFWTDQKKINGRIVRYADDFVILFRNEYDAQIGLRMVKSKLKELGLELNEKKTKVVNTWRGQEGFDFLGFHHRRLLSKRQHRYYTYKWPSNKAMKSIRGKIKNVLGRKATLQWSIERIAQTINPILRGWMNYFKYGNSSKKFAQIDNYTYTRIIIWWRLKHNNSHRCYYKLTSQDYKNVGFQVLTGNIIYTSGQSKAQG